MPAVAIADGSITSPTLALFGRSARATGMENERNNKPTPAQWLFLLNSTDLQRKLEQGTNLQAVIRFGSRRPVDIIEDLYLTILSRFPTQDEIRAVRTFIQAQSPRPAQTGGPGTTNLPTANSRPTKPQPVTLGTPSNLALVVSTQATNLAPSNLAVSQSAETNSAVRKSGPLGSLGPAGKGPDRTVTAARREYWLDIAWALINSQEFLYRH
jgi:hypothetical protein